MTSAELRPVRIGERLVGPGHGVYVIAEAGVNHNGDVSRAETMCRAARDAGADAVKFQAFRTDAFVSAQARQTEYQAANTRRRQTQRDMLKGLELSPDDLRRLAEYCRSIEIEFLASPFDLTSLEVLLDIGVRAVKIASPELTDAPLLRAAAAARRPLIMSTGAAEVTEITEAVRLVRFDGCAEVILLHCLSVYPTPFELQNLKAVQTLMDHFRCVVGYSDHSTELLSGRLAVTLGASVLEKHFTLSRDDTGPDHAMSLEPSELARYIAMARDMPADLIEIIRGNERAQRAIGHGYILPHSLEAESREVSRKSLAARVDISNGMILTRDMLTTLRPGTGISPMFLDRVIGATTVTAIATGTLITEDMIVAQSGDDEAS
ncbi:MAG TPA: N-acetylneuraminate synthase family protein [Planctomycetota bacterium]|nr:N-acetylneuraminate synthase family protein [Planctomycetota bacterium]